MKTTFLLICLLLLATLSQAQVVRIDNILVNGVVFANSAGDSVFDGTVSGGLTNNQYIPIAYQGGKYGLVTGQSPDSIHMTMLVATDTVVGKMYFKAFMAGTSIISRDIAHNFILASKGFADTTIARSSWIGKDFMGAAYSAAASTNGTTSTNKVYVRISRYFTMPKQAQ